MIKKIYLLPLLLLSFIFVACNESEESSKYDNWQARNEAFIDSLKQVVDLGKDPSLKKLVYSRDKKLSIFYKELVRSSLSPNPTKTESPKYTSTVKAAYRGMYIDESVFAKATAPFHFTELYKDLPVFDSSMEGDSYNPEFDSPVEFSVTGVIVGWTEILQHMKPGDRWEVYIPYQLGYGETGKVGTTQMALGYSTLIFDMELLDVEY